MSYFEKSNLNENLFSPKNLCADISIFKFPLWKSAFDVTNYFLGDTRNFAISARSSAFFANMKTLLEWMDPTYFYIQDCFKFTTESMLKLK